MTSKCGENKKVANEAIAKKKLKNIGPTPSTEATQIILCSTGGFIADSNAMHVRAREVLEVHVYRLYCRLYS